MIRHTPRRSNLAHQRYRITRWKKKSVVCVSLGRCVCVRYAGNLKLSPRASIAQAMRAFLAAMATTAFQ
jgi:hypothetical protein